MMTEPKSSAVSFKLLVLKTRQMERVRTFYQSLGIDLHEEQHGNGPLHFAGSVGEGVLEIYPLPDDNGIVDRTTRLGFAVRNLGSVLESLQAIGTTAINPMKATAWGIRAVVQDPDGRAVELYEHKEDGT